MNKGSLLSGLLGVVIGVFLTSVFSPVWGGMMGGRDLMMGDNQKIQNTGNTRMTNNIDRHFIEQMIPHHEGAVDMATLALEKSKRIEIKTLATSIIDSQTKEIDDMQEWYREWFGKDVSKGDMGMMGGGMMSGSGMHMGEEEDIASLENATDFDRAFLEAMIPHHQMALMMVRMLSSATNRPEMVQLAKNITTSQSKEIEDMQSWYMEWYGQ